jgi:hypothetical protein
MEVFNSVSILSWNVRGANNPKTKRYLKELINRYHPTLLIIMETHSPFVNMQRFWDHQGYSSVAVVDAQGHSGGLWILKQNGLTFDVQVDDVYLNAITVSISLGNNKWFCTGLYASPTPSTRANYWNYLCNLSRNIMSHWFIIGDFNEIIAPGEQRGGAFHPSRADSLINVMDHCNLIDLNSVGGKFTWHINCNNQRGISKKLDRGMANLDWRLSFPEAYLETLCRVSSDHNPILMRCGGLPIARGTRPFRFEAAWISHSDYEQLVKDAWTRGRGLPILGLNTIREESIIFNKEVFGNIFKKKRSLENRLNCIQRTMERVDSTRLINLEYQLQQELDQVLYQEELLWYQKSREKWIKFGDKNTKFFHAQTIIRRKRNKIHGITLPSGAWCTDDTILQEEAVKYFKNLFSPPDNSYTFPFDVGDVPKLDAAQIQALTQQITKEEVLTALNQMHPLKAPGPDGFHGVFFRQYWHILGEDIYEMINQAFTTGQFNPTLAETLICLIPKVDCPKHFKDFRPISLCNTLYKLVTKILVNRLRPMLDSIIGPFQSSFLPGRG